MQYSKFRNSLGVLVTVLVTAFVVAGCIKEDLTGCYEPKFTLQVRAFDADGKEVGSETVKDVTLYIFDENKKFIDFCQVTLWESVILDYPDHDTLTLVAWGNCKQGHQTMPALQKGDYLETAFVSLIQTQPRKISLIPEAGSPDDLFHGIVNITTNDASGKQLDIRRKTSGVVITTRYLKEYVGTTEGEFSYSLRKSADKLDFYGKPNGMDISYCPDASFNGTDDFVSSIFNILPTDADIKIDIFHQDVLQTTIVSDNQGHPIRAVEGRLLNVFINFKGNISVSVSVTRWGEKEIWKEF